MWLGVWAGRRALEDRFRKFVNAYHEFRMEDTTPLCPHHHAEIHQLYDEIIGADRIRLMRHLSEYSWTQANNLMDKLERRFKGWVKLDTPGIDSDAFTLDRRTRKLPR